ncbi:large subunit ribosomal protein L18 [Anseongella ginsenosidimutans]|uniref:Large ribosomal subunit protein uL18 n=2 Tax=Anseongella ginsenosidimutans TaxID=496056 RepID=A0A4R3KMU3_9SPHI|nr:50S ribosomal protein L18 [Anseongella ginsenosidimutans]QEC54044.1 50S ribosomal protein L18 [Anseongella ginsenosidimutans]TCS85191.1 large subunit ribosomal protein L18 [Anseongella ginsenosidimutans]
MAKGKRFSRRDRIRLSIRKRIAGTSERPRLTVFRSNKAIYAQLIDDNEGKTLLAASVKDVESTGNKTDQSKEVGKKLAEKAAAAGISEVVFDRNGYLYHGRVKSLADGAREGGLRF